MPVIATHLTRPTTFQLASLPDAVALSSTVTSELQMTEAEPGDTKYPCRQDDRDPAMSDSLSGFRPAGIAQDGDA